MQIYVQIYDNDEAFTTYEIEQPITVLPDVSNLQIIKEKLILNDPFFESNRLLNVGSFLSSIEELQVISSLLNVESLADKKGLILTNNLTRFPQIYGPMSTFSGVIPVKKL